MKKFPGLWGAELTLEGARVHARDGEGRTAEVRLTDSESEGPPGVWKLALGGLLVIIHQEPRAYCPQPTLTVLLESPDASPGGPLAHEQVSVEFDLERGRAVVQEIFGT